MEDVPPARFGSLEPVDVKRLRQPEVENSKLNLTIPILIAVLGGLEVLVLGILFFFETPLTPYARRASESISGTIALVASVLAVLFLGTAIFWAVFNNSKRRGRQCSD